MGKEKFIFADRDGVINRYCPGKYINSVSDFSFLPGVLEAFRLLREAGVKVIVVSNQAGVGKGLLSREKLDEITSFMTKRIEEEGGAIEEVVYCPHKPEENCDCRKPHPGMLLNSAKKYGIDLSQTYFVGDNPSDVQAASSAGCRSVLVLCGMTDAARVHEHAINPDYVAENLLHFTKAHLAAELSTLSHLGEGLKQK